MRDVHSSVPNRTTDMQQFAQGHDKLSGPLSQCRPNLPQAFPAVLARPLARRPFVVDRQYILVGVEGAIGRRDGGFPLADAPVVFRGSAVVGQGQGHRGWELIGNDIILGEA